MHVLGPEWTRMSGDKGPLVHGELSDDVKNYCPFFVSMKLLSAMLGFSREPPVNKLCRTPSPSSGTVLTLLQSVNPITEDVGVSL